jgi:hypothetical protein
MKSAAFLAKTLILSALVSAPALASVRYEGPITLLGPCGGGGSSDRVMMQVDLTPFGEPYTSLEEFAIEANGSADSISLVATTQETIPPNGWESTVEVGPTVETGSLSTTGQCQVYAPLVVKSDVSVRLKRFESGCHLNFNPVGALVGEGKWRKMIRYDLRIKSGKKTVKGHAIHHKDFDSLAQCKSS